MTEPLGSKEPASSARPTQSQPATDTPPDEMTALVFTLMKVVGAAGAQRQVKRYGTLKFLLWSAVFLVLVLFLCLAYRAKEHTFEQLLFVTLFGGVAAFAIAPTFLRLASKWPFLFPLFATLVAVGLGSAAYAAHGLWQHLLLELSVAFVLVLGLDQLLKGTIRHLEGKQNAFSESGKKWMKLAWSDLQKAVPE